MSGSVHWFAGADSPFLAALRRLATEHLAGLLEPDETVAYPHPEDAPLVEAEVLGIPAGSRAKDRASLQVLWRDGVLGGYWSRNNYLWDDYDERDPESLVVKGLPLTDDEAARVAMDWLAGQLARPVELREWHQNGVTVARAWVLADTGVEVAFEGSRRKRRSTPSRSKVIRGEPKI